MMTDISVMPASKWSWEALICSSIVNVCNLANDSDYVCQ